MAQKVLPSCPLMGISEISLWYGLVLPKNGRKNHCPPLHDPLQYSGLENSMDCVHGVINSRTQLSDFHFPFPYIHRDWSTQVLGRVLVKRVYFNNFCVYSNLNPGKEWRTAPLSGSEAPLNHCDCVSTTLPLWISVPLVVKEKTVAHW